MWQLIDLRRLCVSACLWLAAALTVLQAQDNVLTDLYDDIPDSFQEVYLDYVEDNDTRIITTPQGQFLGNTRDDLLYGYGVFYSDEGSQWFGQFRKGECIFGIILSGTSATVGSKTHYAYYDLESCRLIFVRKSGGDRRIPEEESRDYHFESLNYANGDRYIGETYKGNKHGYGIYYWANGNYWYGQFRNNIRYGYGALFVPEGYIYPGKWLGDEKVRR